MTDTERIKTARRELFAKLAGLFIWELPENIPAEFVEYELLKNGQCGFFYKNDKPYAIRVAYGGTPNAYFKHDTFIYANPVLGSGEIKDGENGIIGYNDYNAPWQPFTTRDIIYEYAELLAAVDNSLFVGLKNCRCLFVATTDNQQSINGFNNLMRALWDGEKAFAIDTDTMVSEGLQIMPAATIAADYLRQIAESREYIINSFMCTFGVHANTILKRERQLTSEIDMQTIRPQFNIFTMLKEREKLARRLSAFFGYPVSVKLNPILQKQDNEPTETKEVLTDEVDTEADKQETDNS